MVQQAVVGTEVQRDREGGGAYNRRDFRLDLALGF